MCVPNYCSQTSSFSNHLSGHAAGVVSADDDDDDAAVQALMAEAFAAAQLPAFPSAPQAPLRAPTGAGLSGSSKFSGTRTAAEPSSGRGVQSGQRKSGRTVRRASSDDESEISSTESSESDDDSSDDDVYVH